ncbi:MAG: SDR family oxidoreductase [Desulfovibrio sp.]|nr:SDR family oxidoreductase [Desulfovibrio sp.]
MNDIPVAVITGGSRGIGKAAARECMDLGFRVVLVARSERNLEATRRELCATFSPDAAHLPETVAVDVASVDAVEKGTAEILRRHGRVDLLFNSAGISIPGTLDMDAETFTRLFEINLRAPFLFMRALVPHMAARGGGRVINVASRNGKVAVAGLGGYSASKYGLVGLSEAVYRAYAARGVSITTICPGWVNTEMAANEGPSLRPEEMIQPEDIAKTLRWLVGLGPSVRVMEILLECAGDVERRASVELAKLYALKRRHEDEFDALDPRTVR